MSSLLVNVVDIKNVVAHPNADNLEIVTVKGWNVVAQKGRYEAGNTVVYVPPDSVLPVELSDRLGVTKYLSKGRVKSIKLRGAVSCGLIMENECNWRLGTDVAAHYGITKFEPPLIMGGQNTHAPDGFHSYTDIENWNNYPDLFQDGEEVWITEKIHGSNWRAGLINGQFYVGSHHRCMARDANNLYWNAALKYNVEEKLRQHFDPEFKWMVFGEIYGRVQDLKYGLNSDTELRLFDISQNGVYLDYGSYRYLNLACHLLDVPRVPEIYRGPYSAAIVNELCQGQAFQGGHLREGIVIRPYYSERSDHRVGRVILKKINPEYLVRKHGSESH